LLRRVSSFKKKNLFINKRYGEREDENFTKNIVSKEIFSQNQVLSFLFM